MNVTERELVGIAESIRQQLLLFERNRQRLVQGKLGCVIDQIQRFEAIRRKLAKCDARGWRAAAGKVMREIESASRDTPYLLQGVGQAVEGCKPQVPSVADVYRELLQTDEEFDEVRYDKEANVVAVSTDSIELESLYLGPFEIQLHVPSLSELRYNTVFRIVALDPQPAASNECVTHPHVSDGRLCTGDAGAAINTALASGRICDFFLLVRSVLTTYNPGSPYVSIDDWHGTPCYECGYTTNPDSGNWCGTCEHDFCDECSSYCRCCDQTACLGCLQKCEACSDPVCPSCMTTCPNCERDICKACLDEILCPCNEENEENDNDPDDGETIENGQAQPSATEAA